MSQIEVAQYLLSKKNQWVSVHELSQRLGKSEQSIFKSIRILKRWSKKIWNIEIEKKGHGNGKYFFRAK